jgi:Probable Zinc-ribbon domain
MLVMLLDTKIEVKWTRRNRRQYESHGYIYSKIDDPFCVFPHELAEGSNALVYFQCDYCLGVNQTTEKSKMKKYRDLLSQRKNNGKDCCNSMECKNKKTHEVFILNLIKNKETLGDKFPNLLSQWSNKNNKSPFEYSFGSEEKVWWICEKGHEWEISPNSRTRGSGCPYCAGYKVCLDNCLSTIRPDLAMEWDFIKNHPLTPNDVTKGYGQKVWWVCKTCNHNWKIDVAKRSCSGNGCPQCKESKGEKRVRKFLEENNIAFKTQYWFKGLVGVGGNRLKYDFAIMHNKHPVCMIEFDGAFHFNSFYNDDGYEKTVEHDKRKNEYCMKNNIPLIRIPYWEFENIETILESKLFKKEA